MRKCCSLFCYPNEGNMSISKNTYYGKQNVPSVRKNYGHSFAVIFIPYATFRFPIHKNEGNIYYGK